MNGTRRGTALIACAAAGVALYGTAGAATPNKRIQHGKGIGGIKLEMSRGQIDRLLKKPQQTLPLRAKSGLYLAHYTDDALYITYRLENAKGKQDARRDRYDRAQAFQTFSPRYKGTPSVGKHYGGTRCTPIDRHEGPDGGPRRAGACFKDSARGGASILQMGFASSRSAQRVTSVGVYGDAFGEVVFDSLMAEALERLGCETPACD
jgi:hypothetical protein